MIHFHLETRFEKTVLAVADEAIEGVSSDEREAQQDEAILAVEDFLFNHRDWDEVPSHDISDFAHEVAERAMRKERY